MPILLAAFRFVLTAWLVLGFVAFAALLVVDARSGKIPWRDR